MEVQLVLIYLQYHHNDYKLKSKANYKYQIYYSVTKSLYFLTYPLTPNPQAHFPQQFACPLPKFHLKIQQLIKVGAMDQYFEEQLNMYLIENSNQREEIRKPSFSLQKSNDNIQTYKTKMNSEANLKSAKGKYIDKLKNFTQNLQSYGVSELEEGYSMHSLSKRERNRISAKQSRDRKKLYIELMEYEQKKLEQELESVGKEIQQTKTKISQFCSENKANLGFATRSQLEGKLQRILASNQSSSAQDEINILLDCISFRIGGTGRDRIHKQNQFYKQIINLSLPALHRYLMWAATDGKHVFGLKGHVEGEHDEFPCPLLQGNHELSENLAVMEEIKGEVIEMKKKLMELIEKLWVAKGKTEEAIKKLEEELGQMREILLPSQVAKFILFASRNKYRKDLNFFEEDQQLKQKEIEIISKPGKRVKREQN